MKTTYFLTHESDTCPICGKLLRESRYYDEVACSDPQCRFNDSHSEDAKLVDYESFEEFGGKYLRTQQVLKEVFGLLEKHQPPWYLRKHREQEGIY